MNDVISHLNLEYNEDAIRLEFEHLKKYAEDFTNYKHGAIPGWKIIRDQKFTVANRIAEQLGLICSPRYYIISKGYPVQVHEDVGTLCSINILLGAEEHEPIVYPGYGKFNYKCALINVAKAHGVPSGTHDRVMLKLSITDRTYEEVRDELISKKYII